MKYTTHPLSVLTLSLVAMLASGCSSDNDNDIGDVPVTGNFHEIEPANVETYVSEWRAQYDRVVATVSGVEHTLTLILLDENTNRIVAGFDRHIIGIGFDFEREEPIPEVILIETDDGETIINQYEGEELTVSETSMEDIVYGGTLSDTDSDAEIEVQITINESLIEAGTSTIEISGTDAVLTGDLGTQTYEQMRDMITNNPSVNRLVIAESDGSVNDAINMHTGRLIRNANLATHVPADGDINSGAVDLFAAGVRRSAEEGAILGVHSWCCKDDVTADELSRGDSAHGPQLTYFREMLPGTGVDFYFFTLSAAPFNGIHAMTRDEMTRYGLITE